MFFLIKCVLLPVINNKVKIFQFNSFFLQASSIMKITKVQNIRYYLELSHQILYERHLAKTSEEYHAKQPIERKQLYHKMKLYISRKEHHTMRLEHSFIYKKEVKNHMLIITTKENLSFPLWMITQLHFHRPLHII